MPFEPVKFVPFQVFVDPAFWAEVSRLYLEEWQLDKPHVPLVASYGIYGKKTNDCTLVVGHDALESPTKSDRDVTITGRLLLCNTFKELKELNFKRILNEETQKVWSSVTKLDDVSTPGFSSFYLAAFADLKNYSYYHAVCIPALLYPHNVEKEIKTEVVDLEVHNLAINHYLKNPNTPFFVVSDKEVAPFRHLLSAKDADDCLLVFGDPSSIKNHPGWPLRNILATVSYHKPEWKGIRVLALRGNVENSEIYRISWTSVSSDDMPDSVGWSKVEHVNLKSSFDPEKLMEKGVNMNLKLIRWRMVPSLKLTPFSELKVLIMGAGTLGCNLARSLLGWGVRNFTFVDNSVVSYNNPVRQSLYEFEDCKAGNKQKAEAAAAALKRIYPSVNAQAVNLKIPMPGHPISDTEIAKVRDDCKKLEELIQSHGVVFLVMDSRESRWLPTALAAKHKTLTITVALGFDSFVVIRHGIVPETRVQPDNYNASEPETVVKGSDLGCYYCSDVTGPGNSTDDRTLDQNCTISRAGISMIASGLATELLASLIQHEQGALAPALLGTVDESSSILGGTPHQIRGFISRYRFMTSTVRRFDKCTACGEAVVQQLTERGFDFMLSVFQDSDCLEKVSGLFELQESVHDIDLGLMAIKDSDSD